MTREQILSAINSSGCHCRRCTKDREQVIDKLVEIGALTIDSPPRQVPLTAAEVVADVQLGTERSPSMWLIGRGPHGAERILAALEQHGFVVGKRNLAGAGGAAGACGGQGGPGAAGASGGGASRSFP